MEFGEFETPASVLGLLLVLFVASLAYLFQGENPGVYAGRESDNPSTVHRR